MTKKDLEAELSMLLDAIQALGGSARLDGIAMELAAPIPRRTMQRRLKALVDSGRLIKSGRGPLTLYYAPPLSFPSRVEEAPLFERSSDDYIPVTLASREILEYVRRPLAGRQPVGYDRDFLERYEPNHTWYLDESIRQHLVRIGDTGVHERPAGTYGRAILNRLLIDLSWASSRLEGNTYSRLDTVRLIELGERAAGKEAQEAQMILNHKAAIELIVDEVETVEFNFLSLLNLHGVLSENLLIDPDASGRLRNRPVDISGSVYKPVDIPQLIEEAFREILHKAGQILDPFEQAFFILVHLPYLQPFEDVNKRVSRLAANIPLLKQNLCPLTFLGVPSRPYVDALLGVYEMNRVELLADVFIWAYERSTREYLAVHKSLTEPDPFRLKYRREIHETVARVVRNALPDPIREIEAASAALPGEARDRFLTQVMEDLKRLHEGVIFRYRIRPSEFVAWKRANQLS